jgi:hypothetical protein
MFLRFLFSITSLFAQKRIRSFLPSRKAYSQPMKSELQKAR